MEINLWFFLAIVVTASIALLVVLIIATHQRKIKQLELNLAKEQNMHLKSEVEQAVSSHLNMLITRLDKLEKSVSNISTNIEQKS